MLQLSQMDRIAFNSRHSFMSGGCIFLRFIDNPPRIP